jgi:hypothetical protein
MVAKKEDQIHESVSRNKSILNQCNKLIQLHKKLKGDNQEMYLLEENPKVQNVTIYEPDLNKEIEINCNDKILNEFMDIINLLIKMIHENEDVDQKFDSRILQFNTESIHYLKEIYHLKN